MSEVEERAERVLTGVPDYVWDGETLPVPVEDIADSVFGLLVRDVEDMAAAPGAPDLGPRLAERPAAARPRRDLGERGGGRAVAGPAPIHDQPRARPLVHAPQRPRGHDLLPLEQRRSPAERPERPVPEQEADAFAAALLMPAELMREHYAICRRTSGGCVFPRALPALWVVEGGDGAAAARGHLTGRLTQRRGLRCRPLPAQVHRPSGPPRAS